MTLQGLSKLLSISTADTLAGSFQVDTFVHKLVKVLSGTGNVSDNDDGDDDDDSHEQDENSQLAQHQQGGHTHRLVLVRCICTRACEGCLLNQQHAG